MILTGSGLRFNSVKYSSPLINVVLFNYKKETDADPKWGVRSTFFT